MDSSCSSSNSSYSASESDGLLPVNCIDEEEQQQQRTLFDYCEQLNKCTIFNLKKKSKTFFDIIEQFDSLDRDEKSEFAEKLYNFKPMELNILVEKQNFLDKLIEKFKIEINFDVFVEYLWHFNSTKFIYNLLLDNQDKIIEELNQPSAIYSIETENGQLKITTNQVEVRVVNGGGGGNGLGLQENRQQEKKVLFLYKTNNVNLIKLESKLIDKRIKYIDFSKKFGKKQVDANLKAEIKDLFDKMDIIIILYSSEFDDLWDKSINSDRSNCIYYHIGSHIAKEYHKNTEMKKKYFVIKNNIEIKYWWLANLNRKMPENDKNQKYVSTIGDELEKFIDNIYYHIIMV